MLVKAKTGQRERLSYLRMNKTWKGWLKSPPPSPSLPPPPTSLPLLMAHLCLLSFNKKILNAFLGFFWSLFPLPWPMLSENVALIVRSWCFFTEWKSQSYWLLQQILAVCMGLSLYHIRKNNWLLPFVVGWSLFSSWRRMNQSFTSLTVFIFTCENTCQRVHGILESLMRSGLATSVNSKHN